MLTTHRPVRLTGVAAAVALVAALGACGIGSQSGDGATLATVTVWDPYPQYDESSAWAKYLQACAPKGTTLQRTSAATADLLDDLTTAVAQDTAPDVVLLDNPAVPAAATSGLLATAEQVGFDTTGFDPNLAGPGTVDGVTYGVPVGANTLGLYYNGNILKAVGIDPSTIHNWGGLTDALEQVTAAGYGGITFAGVSGEEGVFQFLPWFWGAGGELQDPGSARAVSAGQLLSDWVAKGYAPKSVRTDNQSQSWDRFLTGKYAFAENGSWFAQAASKQDFSSSMIPIPAKGGGPAPVPTGGEFVLAPLHRADASAHYAAARKIVECLAGSDHQVETANTLGYFAASKLPREDQIGFDLTWTPWLSAIDSAQGRTTDLGAGYAQTSAALSTALQTALGAHGDADKVRKAFEQAAADARG